MMEYALQLKTKRRRKNCTTDCKRICSASCAASNLVQNCDEERLSRAEERFQQTTSQKSKNPDLEKFESFLSARGEKLRGPAPSYEARRAANKASGRRVILSARW